MKTKLRITALILAAVTALSLFAGCNKNNDDGNTGMPEYTYVPTYSEFAADIGNGYIQSSAMGADCIYYLVSRQEGEQERSYSYTDENNETFTETYTDPTYMMRLYKSDLDGKNVEMLPDFAVDTTYKEETASETSGGVNSLLVLKDGAAVVRYESITTYDLPEDFDPETQNRWEYQSHYSTTYTLDILDSTGKTISSTVLSKSSDTEDGDSVNVVEADKDGNIYAAGWESLTVYSSDMVKLFSIKGDDGNGFDSMVRLSDGSVAVGAWGQNGIDYRRIDINKKALGDVIPSAPSAYSFIDGAGDYLLFYRSSSGIIGIKADGTTEETINWLDSDINVSDISQIIPLDNGDFICISSSYDDETDTNSFEIVRLTKTKYDPSNERKIITVASMGLRYDLRQKIMDYNKTNTEYRIRVTDYNQYNTGDDISAGVTKLNTEIIAGHAPDIFVVSSSMPVTQYAGKGVLEDVTPYMERDFGKDAFVEDFFKTLRSDDGKLYEIYANFYIETAIGLKEVVGDGSSWNFDDMQEALNKLSEEATVLDETYSRERAVQDFIYGSTNRFVEWETGKCSFDSQEFIDLLNFVKSFRTQNEIDASHGDDYRYVSGESRVNSGKQLLFEESISDLDYSRGDIFYILKGEPSFVGYPGIGNSFGTFSIGFAISAKSQYKDAAWDFVKYILTEEYQNDNMWDGFPTNKAVFEERFKVASTPDYIDPAESGEESGGDYVVYDSVDTGKMAADTAIAEPAEEDGIHYSDFNKGTVNEKGWKEQPKTYVSFNDPDITGDKWWDVPIFAMTEQEETALRNLIGSVTVFGRNDTSLSDIIEEETQAFFNGQKSAEDTAKMIQSRATIYVNEQR